MNLKEKATIGFAWNSLGSVGTGLCNLAITVIMARLLTPNDFGLLAILVIFTMLSETLIDSGFSQALIQDKKSSDYDLNTVFFTNLFISFFIYFILYLLTPVIAGFYENEELINLSRFVFLSIIFNALSIIQKTIYSKKINFKAMAFASLFSVVFSGTISIVFALKGFGVWALAIHLVLSSFLQMIFLWFQSQWRPSFDIRIGSLKKYIPFSAPLLVQGFIDKVVSNLESLLIGRFYSISELGFYSQSRNLSSYLTQAISNVVQRVTYPVLVEMNNDSQRLKEGYRQIIGTVMLFMIPLSFGVVATADTIVLVLFGEKWIQTAEYLRFLIVMGLFISLHSSCINIFLTLGKTSFFLKLSLIKQFLKLLIVFSLIGQSVKALVIGVTIISVLTSLVYVYFSIKLINYSMKEMFMDLNQIIISSFISALIVFFINVYSGLNSIFIILFVQAFFMMAIYFLLLYLFKNRYLQGVIEIFMKIYSRRHG